MANECRDPSVVLYAHIYKKGDNMDCNNYITIAFIPQASTVVLVHYPPESARLL